MTLDLLPILEAAGLDVTAGADYKTWARPYRFTPVGTMVHHTASSTTTRRLIHDGYPGLTGPLSQLFIETNPERRLHLVSNGYCNHAGRGMAEVLARTKNDVAPAGDAAANGNVIGNRWYYAVELEGPPIHTWAYIVAVRAFAAIHVAHGWPAERCASHREWTKRKVDPEFRDKDMDDFRRDLHEVIEEMTMGTTEHETKHQFAETLPLRARTWADTPWLNYVEAGGSTVVESRTWRTSREDLAWLHHKFLRPQAAKLVEFEERLAEVESTAPSTLEVRVAELEAKIEAINAATD